MILSKKKLTERRVRREIYFELNAYRSHLRQLYIDASIADNSGLAQAFLARMQGASVCCDIVANGKR